MPPLSRFAIRFVGAWRLRRRLRRLLRLVLHTLRVLAIHTTHGDLPLENTLTCTFGSTRCMVVVPLLLYTFKLPSHSTHDTGGKPVPLPGSMPVLKCVVVCFAFVLVLRALERTRRPGGESLSRMPYPDHYDSQCA